MLKWVNAVAEKKTHNYYNHHEVILTQQFQEQHGGHESATEVPFLTVIFRQHCSTCSVLYLSAL